MIEIEREIDGAYDFELGRERVAPLLYNITWPQEGEATGLVMVIAGFGADVNSEYSTKLRRHVVETTGMGAVSVRYHAIGARAESGAELRMENREKIYLYGLAALHGGVVDPAMPTAKVIEVVREKVPGDPGVRVFLDPARGEYQNFGVVQALDHLAVIGDLLENAPPFDVRRIVVLGSSHGAYIGHMMAKIAPSTIAAVIDNSSYAQPPMNYLGIGGEPEAVMSVNGLKTYASVKSGWTVANREHPDFYDRDRDLIRDLRFLPHAQVGRAAAGDAGTQFFMVNCAVDAISPPDVKRRQHAVLTKAGFQSELQMVEEADLDGKLFKTFAHGLDCSLKRLFDREIGKVRPREAESDAQRGSVISYDCVDRGYRFTHSASAPYVTAETYDLYPLGGSDQEKGRSQERAA